MKKQILLASSIFISGILCAQVNQKVTRIPSKLANITMIKTDKPQENGAISILPYQIKASAAVIKNNQKVAASTENIVGNTVYDLQSNSSVADRIVVNADGTIATVWTMAQNLGDATFADRGTGYAYFDGSTWSAPPTSRIEGATKVGWGNVVNTRSGREMVISHTGGASGLNSASRAVKGTGAWTNATGNVNLAIASATTGGNLWPRMVTSSATGGDTIYVISVTSQTTATAPNTKFQGLNGAVCFSRSKNGGVTWDIVNTVPAGLTAATFLGHGGDAYAIAAKGSTVVIVAGDSGKDLVMTKSTDAGATWTAKTVLKFPIPLWNPQTTISDADGDGTADTLYTNDGNLAIALDNNNNAFVAYGRMRILNVTPTAGSNGSYFPYTDGLYLWDESMPQDVGGNMVAAIEDVNGDNNILLPTPTTGLLPFGNFGCSLTSYPSLAFDASNTLYMSYCSVVDSMISLSNDPQNVRHVYVMKSCDNGANFTVPYDVVPLAPGTESEGMFASMAKNVDGNIHLLYQRDFFPGYGVAPATGTDPDPQNVDNSNDIVYVKVPVADLGNCPIPTGIKNTSTSIGNLLFYPNPASSNATIDVVLNETAKLDIAILNSVGQTVYSTSISGNTGSNKVNVNLNNLSAGLYFYQVKVGNSKAITNKFAVEK